MSDTATRTDISTEVPKVGFVSLGCPKALTDSELILTQLSAEGYQTAKTFEGADLVIVNTCGFIDDAVKESLDTIGEALAENGKVIVTGCLGAREGDSGGNLVRQLRELGYRGTIVVGNGMNTPNIYPICQKYCDGLLIAQAYSPELNTPANRAFVRAFAANQARSGSGPTIPPQLTAQAYTARAKATLAMSVTGLPYGVASEASYGPLPGGWPGHEEILLFRDDVAGIEIIEGYRTPSVPGVAQRVSRHDDLAPALVNGLPAQGLIVRPAGADGTIIKGVNGIDAENGAVESLLSVVEKAASRVQGVGTLRYRSEREASMVATEKYIESEIAKLQARLVDARAVTAKHREETAAWSAAHCDDRARAVYDALTKYDAAT